MTIDFTQHDYKVPAKLRVSCGFPSKLAFSAKKQRIGECWTMNASQSGHYEMFISPVLSDPCRVLDVLAHEMVHAIVGLDCGHKGPFKKCAMTIGLTGKMTATIAGPELIKRLNALANQLGPYPHAEIISAHNGQKKQGTRMLKVECPACGYVVRTTVQWIDRGLPTCCCGEEMTLAD